MLLSMIMSALSTSLLRRRPHWQKVSVAANDAQMYLSDQIALSNYTD